jgi:excisionase family DNA binding protein
LLLSVPEVADLLRIHRTTVYDLLATGELRSTTLGRRRLIPRAAVEEFVDLLDSRAEREAAEYRALTGQTDCFDGSARDS